MKLLSNTVRVETPFIIVTIAGYAFGKYSKKSQPIVDPSDGFSKKIIEYFPNFVTDVDIVKVNGSVNTYTIKLVYAIRDGDDPNKIDKILSNVSSTRKLTISYGDYSMPTFIYKDEEAIITKVQQQLDVQSSKISYTITAVGAIKLATEGSYTFPKIKNKPSNILKELLNNSKYGLKEIFYGMRDSNLVSQQKLIADNDKEVILDAKINISIFDYMNYLVSCMTSIEDNDNTLQGRHKYTLACFEDTTGILKGPYFKVSQVPNNIQETTSLDTYELDIGFSSVDAVINFSINTDESYTLLYNYNEKQLQNEYIYRLNDQGEFDYITTSPLLKSKNLFVPGESEKTWWSQVTQYPLNATVTLKGLLRPAILMSCVKVNVFFYGRKYNASGTYMITKQQDQINESGYRTTLNLVRIKGDSL